MIFDLDSWNLNQSYFHEKLERINSFNRIHFLVEDKIELKI
jgi:hypothetical protein